MITGRHQDLAPLLTPEWSPEAIRRQAAIKSASYQHRPLLQSLLEKQYQGLDMPPALRNNLEAINRQNALCIVTAHQPLLFGGKLYFLYKALSTIRLARYASEVLGDTPVVPVFVLGSEDHDFEEVRHVRVFHDTLSWEEDRDGAIGRFPIEGALPLLDQLEAMVGTQAHGDGLIKLLREAYRPGRTFAEATFHLLYHLLGQHGLIVLNPDTPEAKQAFLPVMEAELQDSFSRPLVAKRSEALNTSGLKTQAHARDINLFYLQEKSRARIERLPSGDFQVVDTEIRWTQATLMEELHLHPERFSPNVILRPLFQEMLLPNLAYVGGGGELAYWLELPLVFAKMEIPFPLLVRRHSALLLDDISQSRMEKLQLEISHFFRPLDELLKDIILGIAGEDADLTDVKKAMDLLLEPVRDQCRHIDPNLEKSYEATLATIHKQLEVLESKLVRGLKQQHEQKVQQVRNLHQKLLPGGAPQERVESVVSWVSRYGTGWIEELMEGMDPCGPALVTMEMQVSD